MAAHLDRRSPPHISRTINAGLLVSNEERRRWFKQKCGIELGDREDLNVPLRLSQIVRDNGMALGCIFAPRLDFLVIAQCLSGCWRHDGPDEEVLTEDVKPIETVHEERIKEWLGKELGKWLSLSTFGLVQKSLLGIKTSGFKSYFIE